MATLAEYKIGIWAFLVSVAYLPGIVPNAILGRWLVVMAGIPLVGSLSITRLNWLTRVCLGGLLVWGLIGLSWTLDLGSGIVEFIYLLTLVGVFITASNWPTIGPVLWGLSWGIGLNSILVLWQLGGHDPLASANLGAGTFWNNEVLVEFSTPILVWWVVQRNWLGVELTCLPTLVSGSRVAWGSLVVGLGWWLWPKNWWLRVGLIVGLVIGGSILVFETGSAKLVSAEGRWISWKLMVESWTWFGNGLGFWRSLFPFSQFSHSDVIQMISELGLGFGFLVGLGWQIWKKVDRNGSLERVAAASALVALAATALVSFPLHLPAGGFLGAALAGWLVGRNDLLVRIEFDGRTGDRMGVWTWFESADNRAGSRSL